MKVGIITYHNAYSYGAQLQAYALQEVVRSMGHDAWIIDYKGVGFDPPSLADFKFAVHRPWRIIDALNRYRSKKAFLSFAGYQRRASHFDSYPELMSNPPEFDAYICGSDQVWQPKKLLDGRKFQDEFFLSFVKNGGRKIAYAPSMGVVPAQEFLSMISDCLKGFDFISVREENMADPIGAIVGHEVPVVCDPTILLGREGFDKLLSQGNTKQPHGVFYYPLSLNLPRDKNLLKQLQKRFSGVEIVSRQLPLFGIGRNVIPTPVDWIRKIRDAEFVLTNSFHGTVFAILYHKPFVSLSWNEPRMSLRIVNLLEKLGLGKRFHSGGAVDECLGIAKESIDWVKVEERLRNLQAQGAVYLRAAIGK